MLALLDSGAQISILDSAAAKAARLSAKSLAGSEQTSHAGIGSRAVRARLGSFDSFSIGGETVQRPKIRVAAFNQNHQVDDNTMATAESISKGTTVILGTDFLKARRLRIACALRAIRQQPQQALLQLLGRLSLCQGEQEPTRRVLKVQQLAAPAPRAAIAPAAFSPPRPRQRV